MTEMHNMKGMERKLQKADRKHSRLYLICNFIALMIISAFSALMCSKTVQTVFPQGGDSRKQMYAIFVMTLAGCVVFTIYAVGLFFRHKSRQLGVLMAIGASRRMLLPGLFREVFFLSSLSAATGILAGFPFVGIIWGLFRLLLVDSAEMALYLDFRCLYISGAFFLLVVAGACFTAWRYLKKTNIMEVIREEHINEPVKQLGRWCGPAGFLLILAGGVMGYKAPVVWMRLCSSYPPSWLSVLYVPVFVGLYMVMLHTVVHGWKMQNKTRYKDIISRGMMKFQGRQTVNNMLVITLLIAGAAFAIFYLPMGTLSSLLGYRAYACDYFYQYRADQKIPERGAIEELARQHHLSLKDWKEAGYITLGAGGEIEVSDGGGRFHIEYEVLGGEVKVISEDAWYTLTGHRADVLPGTYLYVTNTEETSIYTDETAEDLTNMVTGSHIDTEFAGFLHYDLMAGEIGYYVLDNEEYRRVSQGLTDEWRGRIVQFNADGKDSYPFASELYRLFVDSFDESCEQTCAYDRVVKIRENEKGRTYWMDTELGDEFKISFDQTDSMMFKTQWAYKPSFRILLINDYLRMTGVLYMMFFFVFIVCLTTALVICNTRCRTIALNNRYIFDDLKKLGAPPDFLNREVNKQCSSVFITPALVGMTTMYILFAGIVYGNDGKISSYEVIALGVCLGILILMGAVVYIVYRSTVRTIKRHLLQEQS